MRVPFLSRFLNVLINVLQLFPPYSSTFFVQSNANSIKEKERERERVVYVSQNKGKILEQKVTCKKKK